MKIDNSKLDLALARKCMNISQLRKSTSPQTLTRIRQGQNVTPATLGKIAQALGVDPADLMETEVKQR